MDGVAPFKYDMWSRARPKEGVDMFKVLTSVLGCSHRDVEWELRCLREGSLRSLLLAANNTAVSDVRIVGILLVRVSSIYDSISLSMIGNPELYIKNVGNSSLCPRNNFNELSPHTNMIKS